MVTYSRETFADWKNVSIDEIESKILVCKEK